MRFLAFEGLDGSGKSTLMQGLKAEFERRGQAFTLTREPGGTKLGDEIRTLLLRTDGEAPTPRAEALLYQAGRAQHVECLIRPALAKGHWVLSDRFAAASLAFQARGRDLRESEIEWLNQFSTQGLEPDLYVLLDLTVEESQRRLNGRGEPDRFEREKADFHERVRQAYLIMAARRPEKWLLLSAADSPEELLQKTLSALKARKWLD
jgi:dTMP kinase